MNSLTHLQELLRDHCPGTQLESAIPGLILHRADAATLTPMQTVYRPMLCVVAQGSKRVTLGGHTLEYSAARYLISSLDLPVSSMIVDASPAHPYLALSLDIDRGTLADLLLTMEPPAREPAVSLAIAVTEMTPELLDAVVRLLRLLRQPAEIPLLAPLITREILYRLLAGPRGSMLRQIALRDSRTGEVMRAIQWIRENYARPFRMQDLLDLCHMSAPSLHRHFKTATGMSPLQYQKRIRLDEARRLLLTEQSDAASAAFSVGYGSPSQFSREYGRMFGAPPRQDASRAAAEAQAVS